MTGLQRRPVCRTSRVGKPLDLLTF